MTIMKYISKKEKPERKSRGILSRIYVTSNTLRIAQNRKNSIFPVYTRFNNRRSSVHCDSYDIIHIYIICNNRNFITRSYITSSLIILRLKSLIILPSNLSYHIINIFFSLICAFALCQCQENIRSVWSCSIVHSVRIVSLFIPRYFISTSIVTIIYHVIRRERTVTFLIYTIDRCGEQICVTRYFL